MILQHHRCLVMMIYIHNIRSYQAQWNRVQEATHASPQASIPSITFQVLSPRGLYFNTTLDREITNSHSCLSTATLNFQFLTLFSDPPQQYFFHSNTIWNSWIIRLINLILAPKLITTLQKSLASCELVSTTQTLSSAQHKSFKSWCYHNTAVILRYYSTLCRDLPPKITTIVSRASTHSWVSAHVACFKGS